MYQVIARKYRPQNFSELIGQEHVQRTLTNAIAANRIAHGYIFSGQRGTGKTSVARILARCLNCIHGPTATPCGICSSCTEIAAGNSVDVIEIDAASNRGINEMREIRENVRYRPARDRYKIFIVDEAHQITKEAFNALLKTLEEPPEWVVFILCTTEAHEIPNTIASRCQHFTFRSVDFAETVSRMRHIVTEEGIEASDEVLGVVAQAGEGSVRDSLSALDQAIACCGRTLSVNEIRTLLGIFGLEPLQAVADAVKQHDGGKMLEIVASLERNGESLHHFTRELARFWRNLLVAKISGAPTPLIAAGELEQKALIDAVQPFSEEDLTRYLNLTLELYKNLQESLQPRLHLELGLIKLVQAGRLQSIEEAIAALGSSGGSAPSSKSASANDSPVVRAAPATASPSNSAPSGASAEVIKTPVRSETLAAREQSQETVATVAEPHPAAVRSGDLKTDLQAALIGAGLSFTADAIAQSELSLRNSELLIRVPKMLLMSLKDPKLQTLASELIGKRVQIRTEADGKAAGLPSTASKPASTGQNDELRERALSHPGVKRFQELFPDAQVRTVRNLNE